MTYNLNQFKMKSFFSFLLIVGSFVACDQGAKTTIDNDPMSGKIVQNDDHSKGVKRFMTAYTENNMSAAKDVFAENAVFYVNDTKMSVDEMIAGFAVGHQYFDNIAHNDVHMATMFYNNGGVYTNVWYNWSGDIKSTGETLTLRGYGWFKWENGKVVEAYNAFDPTAYGAAMAGQME